MRFFPKDQKIPSNMTKVNILKNFRYLATKYWFRLHVLSQCENVLALQFWQNSKERIRTFFKY
jgi:hypothetical protein